MTIKFSTGLRDKMLGLQGTTTLVLKDIYGERSITINEVDLSIGAVIDDLVVPLLAASGYLFAPSLVKEHIKGSLEELLAETDD